MPRLTRVQLDEHFLVFRRSLKLSSKYVLVDHDTASTVAIGYREPDSLDIVTHFYSFRELLDHMNFAARIQKDAEHRGTKR